MDWLIKAGSELTAKEIYGILELRNEVFVVELQRPIKDTDGEDLKPNVYQLFALDEKKKVVAHLRIHLEETSAHIRRVVVAKEWRGQGCAMMMMKRAIDWLRSNGVTRITIAARQHLQRFYESLNFVPTSERYFHEETAVWHVDMELILTQT